MTEPISIPLPLEDFDRISRTIIGVLNAYDLPVTKKCVLFATAGELILRRHYGIRASVIAGRALYRYRDKTAMVFGFDRNLDPVPEHYDFHMWVEADGWLLDFSSIVFPEMVIERGRETGEPVLPGPRAMLQKPRAKCAISPREAYAQGGFYVSPDDALTLEKLTEFRARKNYLDFIEICADWYLKPMPLHTTHATLNYRFEINDLWIFAKAGGFWRLSRKNNDLAKELSMLIELCGMACLKPPQVMLPAGTVNQHGHHTPLILPIIKLVKKWP